MIDPIASAHQQNALQSDLRARAHAGCKDCAGRDDAGSAYPLYTITCDRCAAALIAQVPTKEQARTVLRGLIKDDDRHQSIGNLILEMRPEWRRKGDSATA